MKRHMRDLVQAQQQKELIRGMIEQMKRVTLC